MQSMCKALLVFFFLQHRFFALKLVNCPGAHILIDLTDGPVRIRSAGFPQPLLEPKDMLCSVEIKVIFVSSKMQAPNQSNIVVLLVEAQSLVSAKYECFTREASVVSGTMYVQPQLHFSF